MTIDASTVRRVVIQEGGSAEDCGHLAAACRRLLPGLDGDARLRVFRMLLAALHVPADRPRMRADLLAGIEDYARLLKMTTRGCSTGDAGENCD